MATSLSIKGKTQGNEAVTSTINYVNPNATNAQLVSLATAMNDLTTNTVSDITRIDKNSLINTIEKLDRNMSITPNTYAWSELSTDMAEASTSTLRFTGDDNPMWEVKTEQSETTGGIFVETYKVPKFAPGGVLNLVRSGDSITATITASLPETDTYKAASVTITVTNG